MPWDWLHYGNYANTPIGEALSIWVPNAQAPAREDKSAALTAEGRYYPFPN
jgi:hypothetical protein